MKMGKWFLTAVLMFGAEVALAETCDPAFLKPQVANSCSVTDQGGSVDAMCGSDHPIRCHADIEYQDGSRGTVYGNRCWPRLTDCFSNGPGAVNPCE
jgi:hypothetical protein